jgi:hypothetical protein
MDPATEHSIKQRLKETGRLLIRISYTPQPLTSKEFFDYLTGETLTGDTTQIEDILTSDYLMIHEIVEISELKLRGIPIHRRTFLEHPLAVYEVHLTATDYELKYALRQKDYDWLRLRLQQAECWFDDPHLPQQLVPKYRALLDRFSAALPPDK